jgi:4-hydroxybutyryl-CoA dehydratase/vinylacetyl-CoA-Delta-isomerase
VPTEERLRILRLIKDITGNHWQVDTIHGEGSMAAQEMFLYGSADWKKFQAAARRAAHMEGWQENPVYGKLPRIQDCVKMPPVDASYQSFPPTAKK